MSVAELENGPAKIAAQRLNLGETDKTLLLSPKSVLEVEFPVKTDEGWEVFKGSRVLHSNARGPGKGGIRYHFEADTEHSKNLAFWMAIKNASVDLDYGGAKGGVHFSPSNYSSEEIKQITIAFAKAIAPVIGPMVDIPAPDVNTNPETMRWIVFGYAQAVGKKPEDVYAVATGKPLDMGGLEGRVQATGYGLAHAAGLGIKHFLKKKVSNSTFAIQGFGNVGSFAAERINQMGGKIIAVSDEWGGIFNPKGIDIPKLQNHIKVNGRGLRNFENFVEGASDAPLFAECDVLLPCALEAVITEKNAHQVAANLIAEGANGPITPEADAILLSKGIPVIPDVLANAGGVIASCREHQDNLQNIQTSKDAVFEEIHRRQKETFELMLTKNKGQNVDLRTSIYEIALQRILEATYIQLKTEAPQKLNL